MGTKSLHASIDSRRRIEFSSFLRKRVLQSDRCVEMNKARLVMDPHWKVRMNEWLFAFFLLCGPWLTFDPNVDVLLLKALNEIMIHILHWDFFLAIRDQLAYDGTETGRGWRSGRKIVVGSFGSRQSNAPTTNGARLHTFIRFFTQCSITNGVTLNPILESAYARKNSWNIYERIAFSVFYKPAQHDRIVITPAVTFSSFTASSLMCEFLIVPGRSRS